MEPELASPPGTRFLDVSVIALPVLSIASTFPARFAKLSVCCFPQYLAAGFTVADPYSLTGLVAFP